MISIICLIAVVALVISLVVVIVNEQIHKDDQSIKGSAEALASRHKLNVHDHSSSDGNRVNHKHDSAAKGTQGGKRIENLCLTTGCVHAASKVLEQMDTSVEPCDDFYTYACGGFLENTVIPEEKVSVNTFSIIGDKLQEQLRMLVTEPMDPNEPEPFKLAKRLYNACVNKSKY